MDNVKAFLKAIKVPTDVIADLVDGKEVDIAQVAKVYEEDRTDVIRAKLEPEIEATVRQEEGRRALASVEGALKGKLKKALGLTLSNVREMSMEDFLERAAEEVENARKGGDEATKKQLQDLIEKYNQAEENLINLKSDLKSKDEAIQNVRREVEEKFQRTKILNQSFDKIRWAFDDPIRIERERRVLLKEIEDQFQVGADGSLKNIDGSVVVKPNDAGIYKSVDEWIADYANQYKLTKQSDPRGGDPVQTVQTAGLKKEHGSYLEQFAKELG